MNRPNIIRATALAVGVGAALALTASASASTVAGHGGGLRFTNNVHAVGLHTAGPTSNRTFAGYEAAVRAGSATVVEASFTVPTLTCTTTDRAIAPGVGVPANKGKTVSAAYIFMGCVNGAATYYPGVVFNGREKDYPTSPFAAGDVIDVTTKVSVNRTRVQVTDVTTGVTKVRLEPGASADDAYIGDAAWGTSTGGIQHVPTFTKVTFKTCDIDGKTLASSRPTAFQRVNSIGTLQISTGGIWPTGDAFSTHFVHS